MARTTLSGPFSALTKETDGAIWIPAQEFFLIGGAWTMTRVAAGNYVMRKTAGANSGQAVIDLTSQILQKIGNDPNLGGESVHDIRGLQLVSLDLVYNIATSNLTSHGAALLLNETTFVNNVAAAIATPGGAVSGTLATATQANPYLTTLTPATILTLGRNVADRQVTLEIDWNAAAGTILDYYGAMARFNYNLL